ncbi:4Fe-4S binding protein [Flavivirga jejuensis]|uniref:4Fe-4S binding protein n=1 Tax=Flavivirga jejuensis TaxID=870487 RepID=UPI00349E9F61
MNFTSSEICSQRNKKTIENAIKNINGCIGCEECIKSCPTDVIRLNPDSKFHYLYQKRKLNESSFGLCRRIKRTSCAYVKSS